MADLNYFPSPAEQDRILSESLNCVKKSAFFMKKSLDEDNLREGLKFARDVLGELRTSQLNPQKYYELYMNVFDQLIHLRAYISEEQKKGRAFDELYELVQHAGNVLPRLYLMCTVGSEYIKAKEANPRVILKDLVELCKGVQHPTRGLFLRSYLCQVSRGLLPENAVDDDHEFGNINHSIDFLLSNFIEMNKLWVRMQFQGSKMDQEKRESERKMLQDLVGKNLTYLSQLDSLDFNLYSTSVLDKILGQVITCEDIIAQQYLMQCVIQCFPDDYHLGTLDTILEALPNLKHGVKLHLVLSGLMDRLAAYAQQKLDTVKEADAFHRLEQTCSTILKSYIDMHAADVIDMYVAMLNFTANVYPDKLDYVNGLLSTCFKALTNRASVHDQLGENALSRLLSTPLSRYNVVKLLALDSYPKLMSLLSPRKRKDMARRIVEAILDGDLIVDTVDNVTKLMSFISPLMKDIEGVGDEREEEEEGDWPSQSVNEDLEEEQTLVARLLHNLVSPNPSEQFSILKDLSKHLEEGGFSRMKFTLPSMIFNGLKLVRAITKSVGEQSVSLEDVFDWLLGLCGLMVEIPMPMMAIRCLLQCAYSASEEANLEDVAYDCFEQTCTLFEESIGQSSEKSSALQAIIGTLHRCHVFGEEGRGSLNQAILGYCSQLLTKDEQCRSICLYSRIFWQEEQPEKEVHPVRDADGVMKALKRCIKLASAAQRRANILKRLGKNIETVGLYVELLNHYLYYFDKGNEQISPSVLQQMLDLVANEMAGEKVSGPMAKFYDNTLEHILIRQGEEKENKYQSIETPPLLRN